MQISIIKVENQPKGKYNMLDVTYKNLTDGKVGNKKLVSFGDLKHVYEALVNTSDGDQFNISLEKNSQSGYWDWTNAIKSEASTTKTFASPAPAAAGRGSYETSEERALKQVYIVRQSSLSTATSILTAGAKTPPPVDAIIDVAKKLEAYVFGVDIPADNVIIPKVEVE